ncbi:hypothetical protein ACFYXF_10505 [Streptomyces sp. NPDC002680]|uniref:hypothetical protein n=1 Tax=Streptomyces sp. NPDC002680 TaxID=3364659 RepID=UPI0036A4505A
MKQTGLSVVVHDASDQDETPGADWTVCFEKATLTKVDFAAVPHGAPCPKKDGQRIPWPKMPKVIGVTYAEAVERLEGDAGRVAIEAAYADEAAYDADNETGSYANWKVCFQSVKAGASLEDKPRRHPSCRRERRRVPVIEGALQGTRERSALCCARCCPRCRLV